ncbi:MAG: LamB/YcsF family protein [Chloroflexi bacterium]|nr:LamB/YcsF family protein [Chloroflexota bacterium]
MSSSGRLPPAPSDGGRADGRIDINADVGESFGPWRLGEDEALIPLMSSVNVACGVHAGDPSTIRRTIATALAAGVAIGAHPGYPDLLGFGRRDMALTPGEIVDTVLYQVAAVAGMVRVEGGALAHVKPHAALYHRAAADPVVADAVADAVARFDAALWLVAPPGSALGRAARAHGLRWVAEAFVDRGYEPDGSLRARTLPGGLYDDPDVAAAQAVEIARDGRVTTTDGSTIPFPAGTLCIHGDTPGAAAIGRAVRRAVDGTGILVLPLGA